MSGQYPAVPRASAGINHDTHFSNPSMFLVVEQHSTIFEVPKKMWYSTSTTIGLFASML